MASENRVENRVENTNQASMESIGAAEKLRNDGQALPDFPRLPERYLASKDSFRGVPIIGYSREFDKELIFAPNGEFHPNLIADPDMREFMEAEGKATLARIDKNLIDDFTKSNNRLGETLNPPDWGSQANGKALYGVIDDGTHFAMHIGSQIFSLTGEGAPNVKLIRYDDTNPTGFKTVIPESKDFEMEQAFKVNVQGADKYAVVGLKDGAAHLYIYDSAGKQEKEIQLPGYGTLKQGKPGANDSQLQFLYSTPTDEARILSLDLSNDQATLSSSRSDIFDSNKFITEKITVPYADREGRTEEVPVYISHNRDMHLDGKNPTLLNVYGGFHMSPQLGFSPFKASWLEHGGVLVQPVLPGDGGRGERYHESGIGINKENTFLATIAVAKKLQEMGISSPETTGMFGGSNGGMVVNAVLNNEKSQGLFGAAVSDSAPNSIFDLYMPPGQKEPHEDWKTEYGNPMDPNQRIWMGKLDVLTNVSAAKQYPPTLIGIGTDDFRVNPSVGITYASMRQAMKNGEALLYTRWGEGHELNAKDYGLEMAFLWSRLTS